VQYYGTSVFCRSCVVSHLYSTLTASITPRSLASEVPTSPRYAATLMYRYNSQTKLMKTVTRSRSLDMSTKPMPLKRQSPRLSTNWWVVYQMNNLNKAIFSLFGDYFVNSMVLTVGCVLLSCTIGGIFSVTQYIYWWPI